MYIVLYLFIILLIKRSISFSKKGKKRKEKDCCLWLYFSSFHLMHRRNKNKRKIERQEKKTLIYSAMATDFPFQTFMTFELNIRHYKLKSHIMKKVPRNNTWGTQALRTLSHLYGVPSSSVNSSSPSGGVVGLSRSPSTSPKFLPPEGLDTFVVASVSPTSFWYFSSSSSSLLLAGTKTVNEHYTIIWLDQLHIKN